MSGDHHANLGLSSLLAAHAPPNRWPSWYRWLGVAREDALQLFPGCVYHDLEVSHRILGQRIIVQSDPDIVRQVCARGSKHYKLADLHLRMLEPALGTGLVVAEGPSWRLQRRLAVRLMPRSLPGNVENAIDVRIGNAVERWRGKTMSSKVLINELVALSIDLIAHSVFQYCDPVAHDDILRAINLHRSNIESMDFMDALGLPKWIQSPRMRRAEKIAHAIDKEIEATIDQASRSTPFGEVASPDVALTRDFVLSLITGFESVATTSLWLMTLLAQHQDLQEEIRQESHVANNVPSTIFPANSALDLTTMETLRLFPPLPFIFRQAVENHSTQNGTVRKGALVCISPWIMHRHSALWDAPNEFRPNRFAGVEKSPSAFIPFGMGARRCAGMGIGYHLIKTIAAKLIAQVRVRPGQAQDGMPEPRAGVSLRPKPVYNLRFENL